MSEDEKTSLTAALRHLAEQERRTPSEHATPGELTAYHEGTLPPPVEARVREHLAHCKLCSDLLLDLAGFADLAPPPGVPELTDAEVEADWQKLRRKMGEGEGKPRIEEQPKPPGEVVPLRRPSTPSPPVQVKPAREFSPWQVVAAALIAAVILTATFVAFKQLKQGKANSTQNASIVEFNDENRVRGGEPDKTQHMNSSQDARFTFHSFDSYASYNGEIVQDGAVVWQTTVAADQVPAPSTDLKEISFRVPGGTLTPGQHTARLFGIVSGGRKELIGRLDFEVDAP